MTHRPAIAFILCVAFASTTGAQFTPVIAKFRQTDETLVAGKVTKSVQREAEYYRVANGSYIFLWVSSLKDGETQPLHSGLFWDNAKGTSYKLDY